MLSCLVLECRHNLCLPCARRRLVEERAQHGVGAGGNIACGSCGEATRIGQEARETLLKVPCSWCSAPSSAWATLGCGHPLCCGCARTQLLQGAEGLTCGVCTAETGIDPPTLARFGIVGACAAGHDLAPVFEPGPTQYGCDHCRQCIRPGSWLLQCGACEYELCVGCAPVAPELALSVASPTLLSSSAPSSAGQFDVAAVVPTAKPAARYEGWTAGMQVPGSMTLAVKSCKSPGVMTAEVKCGLGFDGKCELRMEKGGQSLVLTCAHKAEVRGEVVADGSLRGIISSGNGRMVKFELRPVDFYSFADTSGAEVRLVQLVLGGVAVFRHGVCVEAMTEMVEVDPLHHSLHFRAATFSVAPELWPAVLQGAEERLHAAGVHVKYRDLEGNERLGEPKRIRLPACRRRDEASGFRLALRDKFNIKEVHLVEQFLAVDLDHNNLLDSAEFDALLQYHLGKKTALMPSKRELKALMALADLNGDNRIGREEAVLAIKTWYCYTTLWRSKPTRRTQFGHALLQWQAEFQRFHQERKGHYNLYLIRQLMSRLNDQKRFPEEDAEFVVALLSRFEPDLDSRQRWGGVSDLSISLAVCAWAMQVERAKTPTRAIVKSAMTGGAGTPPRPGASVAQRLSKRCCRWLRALCCCPCKVAQLSRTDELERYR